MNKAFVTATVLLLTPFPAFSQSAPSGDGRDPSYSRRDRDLDEILRGIGDRVAERRRGGEEGDCYILTRSLRDADRDLLVVVRRRVCRD